MKPIDMLLFCPRCGEQHIDRPSPEDGWENPPHRSHLCRCGFIWRPADVPTNGVARIETRGTADTPWPAWTAPAQPGAPKVRHKKRGTVYEIIGDASVQAATRAIHEGDQVVVYRGTDGKLWARPFGEFHDGRFEPVAAP